MRICIFVLIALLSIISASPANAQSDIVPRPAKLQLSGGERFSFHQKLSVFVEGKRSWEDHVGVFVGAGSNLGMGQVLMVGDKEASNVRFAFDSELPESGYSLLIGGKEIQVAASSIKGLTYATASLLQLMGQAKDHTLPGLMIHDRPECSYRSFMVDMGRNPHSIELLKETVDLCWFYKIDSLHLHLTDDQRFAFPSTAFPKLHDRRIGLEEFKDLEAYAVARGVTLIPELDVPGHSTLLRKHYPEVFGKSTAELAKNETSQSGVKKLLDEMMDVFASSPYIHVGGDEAYGVPQKLQREFINGLNEHVKSRNRTPVVWEGSSLGEAGNRVSKDVIHINWRTINFPADQMLAAGHRVVNAAWDPLYVVDHFPGNNFTMASPQHIYDQLNKQTFKHFNPSISTYAAPIKVDTDENLIGFCMPWWEGREENYFHLIVPRVIPMAAIGWNSHERDFSSFSRNAKIAETIREELLYPVSISATPLVLPTAGVFHNETVIRMTSTRNGIIRFTLDGSAPSATSTKYEQPFKLEKSAIVRTALYVNGQQVDHGSRLKLTQVIPPEDSAENFAFGRPVTASVPAGPFFCPERVTDGGTGNLEYFLGYCPTADPIYLTIDLGESKTFDTVNVVTYLAGESFESYEIEVSNDGQVFTKVASGLKKPEKPSSTNTHSFDSQTARYVRVVTYGHKGQVFDSFSRIVEVEVK